MASSLAFYFKASQRPSSAAAPRDIEVQSVAAADLAPLSFLSFHEQATIPKARVTA